MLRRLRRRLTAGYSAVLGLIVLGYSLGAHMLVSEVLAWGAEEGNHHLSMPLANELRDRGLDAAAARRALGALALAPDERLQVLDAQGRVVASLGGPFEHPGPPLPGARTLEGPDRFRVLTVLVERDGRRVGYVRAAHSLAAYDQALARLGWVLAGLFPLALLLAWAAGDRLAGLAVRPVEAAMNRERRFLHDAAHELRTPLAVLTSQAELAAADPVVGEAARARLRPVVVSARQLARLVAALLTLSREEAGAAQLDARCDLDEVVEEEMAQLEPLAAASGIRLRLAESPSDRAAWTTRGEPSRVAQAVRNMLDNAIRYSPPGSEVTAELAPMGDRLALSVVNPGPGMPPEVQAHLFERFYRAPAGRAANPQGTGLGLAISRAIARAQGGDLTVESRLEGPTTFTLTLPTA
ncbi:Sensor protein SrrB [compost metagenome]